MTEIVQLKLVELEEDEGPHRHAPNEDDTWCLELYQTVREKERARPNTVKKEISQLRSIARDSSSNGVIPRLSDLFADIPQVALALRSPRTVLSKSTNGCRLIAAQRFIRIIGPSSGRIPDIDLEALDSLLPRKNPRNSADAGTVVAGSHKRKKRHGPALSADEMNLLVDAAGEGDRPYISIRNRTFLRLLCYSGLRFGEALSLRWEFVLERRGGAGDGRLFVMVIRNGREVTLFLPEPAADALDQMRQQLSEFGKEPASWVFCATEGSERPLSKSGARKVVTNACRRAGFPAMTTAELRSSCAAWLKCRGFPDHRIKFAFGLQKAKSVDRLLKPHKVLNAQRQVREFQPE